MDQNQIQDQPQVSPKQQITERIRQAANVLVTVKSNPSVDELAATIGLTLMLNKLGKHATAVFSGQVPSTIDFLKPEETLEANTDSLRDFIVSLDKSKADKLRYKVEENVVKIFITPYRTSITEKDLIFEQGDFNVDVVLALGVTQREELDQAVMAHGRILHDATVATITVGDDHSALGNINWQDQAASSLCEMLVSISEALQGGIIDSQMATAFLTGIVAETDRFSNAKTSPKVMTMSAQLMAAGANQQLIADELEKAEEIPVMAPAAPQPAQQAPAQEQSNDGVLSIPHNEQPQPLPPLPEQPQADTQDAFTRELLPMNGLPPQEEVPPEQQIHIDDQGNLMKPPVAPKHKVIQPLGPEESDEPAVSQAPAEPELTLPEPVMPGQTVSSQPSAPILPPAPNQASQQTQAENAEPAFRPEADDTIKEIEETIQSPHVAQYPDGPGHVDNARSAVTEAINQLGFDPERPEPRADLNAQPLGVPDQSVNPQPSVIQPQNSPSPPPLPPQPQTQPPSVSGVAPAPPPLPPPFNP